jgi:hypothetical protein
LCPDVRGEQLRAIPAGSESLFGNLPAGRTRQMSQTVILPLRDLDHALKWRSAILIANNQVCNPDGSVEYYHGR